MPPLNECSKMVPLTEYSTEDLLGVYWDLAYSEGRRRVDHDTEEGLAQAVLSVLQSRIMPHKAPESALLVLPKSIQDQLFIAFADHREASRFCQKHLQFFLSNLHSVLNAKIQVESTGSLSVSQNEARVMYTQSPISLSVQ
jgi:hypothetical protein